MTHSDPSPDQQPANTYILDAENGTEMARLLDQDKLATEAMGGLFSEQLSLAGISKVLDIGCGPGGWVNEVAHNYPEMQVTGIDISTQMIRYASAYASVRQLTNAHFQIMDATRPLDFADGSFDLVNARTISAFLSPPLWPQVLLECKRVLRPGGIMRSSEVEWGFANTPAFETLCGLITQAMHLAGRTFSPTGRTGGIVTMQRRLLHNAGFVHIQQKAHVLDVSFGSRAYEGAYQDYVFLFHLIQPFLLKTGIATQEMLDQLTTQALDEMRSEEFCGLIFLLTTWAEVPTGRFETVR